MKRLALFAAILFALPLAAQTAAKLPQDAPKPTPPAKPAATPAPSAPVISDRLKAQFFKAQSFKVQAETQAEKTAGMFQSVVAEMRKVCGDAFTLQTDQVGDPVCVANPTQPVAPKK